MKKIKSLFIQFENEISHNFISSFRGAIIEKVGRDNILFHQHKGDTELLYQYPLIQYKSIGKKASIVCLGDGVDDIHKLFQFNKWDINIQGEKVLLKIARLDLNTITLNVWDKSFNYRINNWIALNKDNYDLYKKMDSIIDKCSKLESIMKANILSFAKGIEWTIEKPIEVKITNLVNQRIIRYKGIPLAAFDVEFKSNVFLPNFIGLGKSVSHGLGVLKMTKNSQ